MANPILIENNYGRLELKDSVGVLWLDLKGEPVNKISPEMLEAFSGFIEEVQKNASIKAVVMISSKKDWIAGADITMFQKRQVPGYFENLSKSGHERLDALATSKKPFVAAIDGAALGGGFEMGLGKEPSVRPDAILELLAVLAHFPKKTEDAGRDRSIGCDRGIQGDGPPSALMRSSRSFSVSKSNLDSSPAPHPLLTGSNKCQTTPLGAGKFRGVRSLPFPFFTFWWNSWFSPEVKVWWGHNFPFVHRERMGWAPALKASSAEGFPESTPRTQVSTLCGSFFKSS